MNSTAIVMRVMVLVAIGGFIGVAQDATASEDPMGPPIGEIHREADEWQTEVNESVTEAERTSEEWVLEEIRSESGGGGGGGGGIGGGGAGGDECTRSPGGWCPASCSSCTTRYF